MENNIVHIHEDLLRLRRDVELIKHILMSEGELTGWAKVQLSKARKQPKDSYISLNEL